MGKRKREEGRKGYEEERKKGEEREKTRLMRKRRG